MSDLISRLSELRSQYSCFNESERDAYHTLSEAIEALKAQHWIPCSERLPEETNKEYLVTVKYNDALGDEIITSSSDYYFSYGWDDYGKEVIAWAELPEPYRGEEK